MGELLPYAIVIGFVALIAWLYVGSRNSAPKAIVIPQFMFTVTGAVHRLQAEAVAGVMTTEHHGGQVEDSQAVAIHRKGRLWFKPKPGRDVGGMRRRKTCYITRQNDSSVLNMHHLFDDSVALRTDHTNDAILPRKNLATRQAMAAGVKNGTNRDALTRRMAVMALISVITAGAAWIAVTITAVVNAPTP